MYKLLAVSMGRQYILRLVDNATIPNNPDNKDYQDYLKWVSEGNTPTPPNVVPALPPEENIIPNLQKKLTELEARLVTMENKK